MTTPSSRSRAAVVRLRTALESTAAALARPNVEGLLASEAALTEATLNMTQLTLMSAEDRAALRDELLATRAALARCRRLGGSLGDFVRTAFDARGVATGYGNSTATAAGTLTGRGISTSA